MTNPGYDSTADTLRHSLRVGALLTEVIHELVDRCVRHDLSKTEEQELSTYNEFIPRLREATYGTQEYDQLVAAMGEGLRHHYSHNRHHPQHFPDGVNDMTLIDLMELLADWVAATERRPDGGDLAGSMEINRIRSGISDQLWRVLDNTARHLGWLPGDRREPMTTVDRSATDDHPDG
jgi:hypothetical protein